ncbi:MAG TPA: hypothetical protein VK843_18085 [Planctomycetota bacterium]|nr:hypothetical protein [Planctomycetota bacterium]
MLFHASLADTGADGRWSIGIGDPTPIGWLTVVGYGLAACFAFGACRRARREASGLRDGDAARAGNERRMVGLWLIACVVMALLGVNKQLDLQSLMTQSLRDLARSQGWYENRREYQQAFIAVVAIAAVVSVCVTVLALRPVLHRAWLTVFGLTWIVTFVLIRAASFHHVDRFLRGGNVRWNWVLELGGIAMVGVAGYRAARERPAPNRRDV